MPAPVSLVVGTLAAFVRASLLAVLLEQTWTSLTLRRGHGRFNGMRDVYLDTTIPSFASTSRSDPVSTARKALTRSFWRGFGSSYVLYVSELVDAEIEAGDWSGRDEAIRLIAGLPRLPLTQSVRVTAETYMNARLMPREMAGDAFHLACASVHSMHVLLTWNVRHLANPTKTDHLAAINRRLGLITPVICTPESLIEEEP